MFALRCRVTNEELIRFPALSQSAARLYAEQWTLNNLTRLVPGVSQAFCEWHTEKTQTVLHVTGSVPADNSVFIRRYLLVNC